MTLLFGLCSKSKADGAHEEIKHPNSTKEIVHPNSTKEIVHPNLL